MSLPFPITLTLPDGARREFPLGVTPGEVARAISPSLAKAAVAAEVARLLREETVRDRKTGVPRAVRAGDIAILFRSRASLLQRATSAATKLPNSPADSVPGSVPSRA